MASPMFLVSGPELVIAQCTAGIIGSFPTLNARPARELENWLNRIDDALASWDLSHPSMPAAPYAVNLIVHRSNDRLEKDLATCVAHRVPIVITSLGSRQDVYQAVHSYGGVVLHDVIHDGFARKAVDKGADGLIAVAAGAGGHAGTQSPFALLQEIREWFEGSLLLSGAIAHGRAILAAQVAGADLAYVGSAFIASTEANAIDAYKQMIVSSGASDIIYSSAFTGVHGNYLRGSIEAAGLDPTDLSAGGSSKMDYGEAKAWRDVWGSGQGIGVVNAVRPVGAIVKRLTDEYTTACGRLSVHRPGLSR